MDVVPRLKSMAPMQSFVWIGICLSLLWWFLESLIHIILFGESDLLSQILTPDPHEIWKRLFVSCLIILFSLYAQYSINIRRRTEAALADREQELSLMLENSPAGIILVDAESRKISWANTNALNLLGSTKELIANQLCHDHLCPTEIGNCPILDQGYDIDSSERELVTSGGGRVPILKSATRVQYNGREHLLETFFDHSAQKKMERDLSQAHAELNQIFQTASVGMRLVDRNFKVLKVNKTFELLTGVTESESVGKLCHETFLGSTCFTPECSMKKLMSGKVNVECYVEKQRMDGKGITCILTASPFVGPEGDFMGAVESFLDVTELKKAQDSVKAERDKLERILSHLHEGVSIINSDCVVEYQNDIFRNHFGNGEGRICHVAVHGRQNPCEPCLMNVALQTEQIQHAEFETPDGKSMEKYYTPVTDIDGDHKVVALWRDVTEKKAATAAIMRAEKLAALGELAAGVAHEINNPINGIINYAQIIFNKSKGNGLVRDISERMIKEADRIARIVEGLLSFTRARHEKKGFISVEEILSDSLALTSAQLRRENIIVETAFADDLPDVLGRADEIEQVFVNIISNARHALNDKYAESHEGKILEINADRVASNGNHYVRIRFKDYGLGIPAKFIDKVRQPFFSTKTGGKRTGLGLSISHAIVEEHGGWLNLSSEEGRYTEVAIHLPSRPEAEP